jgi:hypothetical protein
VVNYDYPLSVGNDTISSFQIPNGLRGIFYQDGFGSNSQTHSTSQSSLPGFDNTISVITVQQVSSPSNYGAIRLINSCTPITCTALAANGYGNQSGLTYTPTAGSGTIICNQTGYSGNANYTCQAQGSATITKTCDCATGYVKDASGVCVLPSNNSFTPNWNEFVSAPAGVYVTTSSNNSIGLAGPNNAPGGSWGYYLANLPTWVTKVSFNWNYYANDYGDYDRGYFFINGGWQYLANNNCTGCSSSGTITNFAISPNVTDRRFGPGVWTSDGCCGAGFLTLSNIVFQ